MDIADFLSLIAAVILFVGWHVLVSGTTLRDHLVRRIGANAYRGLFSLAVLILLAWIIVAYRHAPYVPLWGMPTWAGWLAVCLMPVAIILVVASLRPDNPTGGARPDQFDPRRAGIFAITRHPMMWGIGLWATLHLLANGDVASVILFAGLGGLALGGTLSIDAKKRRHDQAQWDILTATTSNLPFAALADGRARLAPAALLRPLVIGLVVYGVIGVLHSRVFDLALPIF
jgi:uncharacterized membrane protein